VNTPRPAGDVELLDALIEAAIARRREPAHLGGGADPRAVFGDVVSQLRSSYRGRYDLLSSRYAEDIRARIAERLRGARAEG
jgi:hypothetical protein